MNDHPNECNKRWASQTLGLGGLRLGGLGLGGLGLGLRAATVTMARVLGKRLNECSSKTSSQGLPHPWFRPKKYEMRLGEHEADRGFFVT